MTVLITGGAGYIGSHVVLALCASGFNVVVVDDLSTGFRENLSDGVALIEGNVGDARLLSNAIRKFNVSVVIHLAASTVVPDSLVNPLHYYNNNLLNTYSVIKACVSTNVTKLLFSSTAAVYGSPRISPVKEEVTARPISPYGASKLMCERLIEDVSAAHDLNYVILRYFNVAGADVSNKAGQRLSGTTHLIKVASEVAVGKRDSLSIYGTDYPTPDGTCVRDYIHVCDLADAHLRALNYLEDGGRGGLFNVGYGRGYSVLEVIAAVEAEAGIKLNTLEGERRAGDAPSVVADASRMQTTLGWRPRHDDLSFIARTALNFERTLPGDF